MLHVINLVVLFALLRMILWKPLYQYMSARTGRVQAEMDDAARMRHETEILKAEYERNLEAAEAEGREIVRASQLKAAREAQTIVQEAQDQAQNLILEARERIEIERGRAVTAARNEIAQLATNMAERILRREVTGEDNIAAAESFFDRLRPEDDASDGPVPPPPHQSI